MAKQFLQYNSFGIASVGRDRITASVTIVIDDKHSITRSVKEELQKPLADVQPGESLAVSFGAWIEQGKKSKITVREIGTLNSGVPAGEIPEVRAIIAKAIEMVLTAAE